MVAGSDNKVPIREGLWVESIKQGEQPQLLGSRCDSCGEMQFPAKKRCPNCFGKDVKEVKLSRTGKIYSVTTIMQRPPVYYQGPVPYSFGYVELPEGVRVETLFTGIPPEEFKIGMDVSLVIERLYENAQGQEVIAYKFAPVTKV